MREMKDSGVEWLGEVPVGWGFDRFGTFFALRNERVSDEEYPPLSVTMGGVVSQLSHVAKSDDHANRKLVCKGDFAINSRSDRRNSCGFASLDGSVSLINTICVPRRKIESRYYGYLFDSSQWSDEFYSWGHGIVADLWTIGWNDMKKILLPVPPLDEQRRIADCLDEKCAEIDRAVSAAERSIEEYKAYKNSIVNQAITKGLDSDVPMKDSGVEWLGEVPEGWRITPIKHLFYISKTIAGRTGFDVLSITQQGLKVKDIKSGEGQLASDYSHYQIVEPGDFAMNHMDLLTGWVDLSNKTGVTSPDYRVFKARTDGIDKRYFLRVFQVYYSARVFYGFCKGISSKGRWRLPADAFRAIQIPVPPFPEQHRIADYLDEKCAQLDHAIAAKQAVIADLKAYKQSLIYETVTGKREV